MGRSLKGYSIPFNLSIRISKPFLILLPVSSLHFASVIANYHCRLLFPFPLVFSGLYWTSRLLISSFFCFIKLEGLS
jgi:hypothetical protein